MSSHDAITAMPAMSDTTATRALTIRSPGSTIVPTMPITPSISQNKPITRPTVIVLTMGVG